MFQLSREVRFAVNSRPVPPQPLPTNGHGGYPSLTGTGYYFSLQVKLSGELGNDSGYLVNIRDIDAVVRQRVIPRFESAIAANRFDGGGGVLIEAFELLRHGFGAASLTSLQLSLSPFLSLSILEREFPMVRLSQKFEFSATHRLHNSRLSDVENQKLFGKCNNPHGHGHNYELQVTLVGQPAGSGDVFDVVRLERIVQGVVIDRFDHRNLNIELPEFAQLNPTVENIAQVIYRLLKSPLADAGATLAEVTLWETPKTFCQYSE